MRSKKANVVIALLAAIALWVYVAGETNPETKKTFRSIPIRNSLPARPARSGALFFFVNAIPAPIQKMNMGALSGEPMT